MQSKKLVGPRPRMSTQKYLDISEIKEDCVVLKDGTMRAVLLVSSINFALKSEEEQEALISGYVGFLNSLEFPLQIVIQSRKLNIDNYLMELDKLRKKQTNELLKSQMADYIEYVKELVELGDIMTKRFYVVVPYSPFVEKKKGFFDRLIQVFSPTTLIKIKRKNFKIYREKLFKRVDVVASGLSGMGLKSVPLDTQSLIELYYNSYNPEMMKQQKLEEVKKVQVEEE